MLSARKKILFVDLGNFQVAALGIHKNQCIASFGDFLSMFPVLLTFIYMTVIFIPIVTWSGT